MRALFQSTKARLCTALALASACALPASWSWLKSQADVAVKTQTQTTFSLAQATTAAKKDAIVIKHGWDVMTVSGMVRAQREINDSPFDGIVFSGQRASRVFTSTRVPESVIASELNPLSQINFTGPTHNYLIVYNGQMNGGFSGSSLQNLLANARDLGRVAGRLGIEGIAFDNEVYPGAGDPWDMAVACPGMSNTEACRRMAFSAGKAWMEAIQEGWPDVKLISFFGPWLHDPVSFRWFGTYSKQADWSGRRRTRVTCNFLAGVYAATEGKSSQYIDGGEIYSLRSEEDYRKTADWLRYYVPYVTPFFPEEYRANYHKNMGVSFGLYDDRDHLKKELPRVNPQIWGSMIRNAKKQADVVWLYTELHDWWREDGNHWPDPAYRSDVAGYVTSDWVNATRAAIQSGR